MSTFEPGRTPSSTGLFPDAAGATPLRLVTGLGDPQRERELLTALAEDGTIVVVQRCVAAEQLVAAVQEQSPDAALVAGELHRLGDETLIHLAHAGVPAVLLSAGASVERYRSLVASVLPPDAGVEEIRQAIRQAAALPRRRLALGGPVTPDYHYPARTRYGSPPPGAPRGKPRGKPRASPRSRSPVETGTPDAGEPAWSSRRGDRGESEDGELIVITGGRGAPGRTTVAVNLAVALGAVAPTVLVDADTSGPCVAAYLDGDPTRNIAMLAHAAPATPGEWARALEDELQPLEPRGSLGQRSTHGRLLCGLPKAEMRTSLTPSFFERLLDELRRTHRYVVVDTGDTLLGSEATLHHLALRTANRVLLVAATDAIGVWHAREALRMLTTHLALPEAAPPAAVAGVEEESVRVSLILNRYDRRHHHGPAEIGWALGTPVAAVTPYDYGAAQRAIESQRPLVLDTRSRAGRALLELAERLHQGRILLPESALARPAGRHPWRAWAGLVMRVRAALGGQRAAPAEAVRTAGTVGMGEARALKAGPVLEPVYATAAQPARPGKEHVA